MKRLLSFDVNDYTPWQRRTFYCCAFMFLLSVVLTTVGVVFMVLAECFGIKSVDLVPSVVLGGETLVGGVVGIVVAVSGIIGAKDPRKITVFFWIVTLYGLLELWDLASKISQGQVNPAAIITLAIAMFLVACAWNVRGQTGYFDNHPHPEDDPLRSADRAGALGHSRSKERSHPSGHARSKDLSHSDDGSQHLDEEE